MKVQDSLRYFLRKCNVNQLSTNTLQSYEYHLKPYVKFIENLLGEDFEIEDVTEEHILQYLENLPKKYSEVTVRGRYIYLKIFFKTLYESSIIRTNPTRTIRLPKKKRRVIYSFNRIEIQEMLNMFDKSDFIGFRNFTIISLLFGTGIRKAELLGILLQDIQLDLDYITVIGKGNKERVIPIGQSLKRTLQVYIKRRKAYLETRGISNQNLFISRNGHRLTESGINSLFYDIRDSKKQWSTRVSAHTLRHTFAKFFLLNGGDVFTLQKILGHNDISTTKIYVDLNDTEMQMQNSKYNPLDNPRWRYY